MMNRISYIIRACALIVLLITSEFSGAEGRRKRRKAVLGYADCGTGDDKIVHFHTVEAMPVPVDVPGVLYLSLAGNVTSDIPRRVNLYLSVKKYFFGFPLAVPCLSNGVGSCSYENICAILEAYEKDGCPPALGRYGVQCYCPFTAGEFNLVNVPVNIPKIEGLASPLLNGDYELQVQLVEEDGPVLGCLRVKFTLKKRSRGWLFKIKRQDKSGSSRRGGDRKRKRSRRKKRKEGGMSSGSEEMSRKDMDIAGLVGSDREYPEGVQSDTLEILDEKIRGGVNRTMSIGDLNVIHESVANAKNNEKHVAFSEKARTFAQTEEDVDERSKMNNKNYKRNIKRRRRGHKSNRRKETAGGHENAALVNDIGDLSRSFRVSRGLDDSLTSAGRDKAAKRRRRKRRRRKRRKEKESKRRERERFQAEKDRRKKMRRRKNSLVIPTASLPS